LSKEFGESELRSRFLEESPKALDVPTAASGQRDGDTSEARFSRSEKIVLASILTGSFITVWDYFAALVAIHAVQKELGVSDQSAQLILAIFGIAGASGLITGGRLGDLYGRKRLFLIGMWVFAVGALASAAATNALTLTLSRAIQGVATALIQPQVLALLGTRFAGHKARKAFAAFSVAMVLGAVIGQMTAALLMSADASGLGWRICFLVSVPFCLIAILLASRFIRAMPRPAGGVRPDWLGMILSAITLFLLTWSLTAGKASFSVPQLIFFIALAICVGILLWLQQISVAKKGFTPMLPIHLLRDSRAHYGLLAVFIFYLGVTSYYVILGWHLQRDLGLTAIESGTMFLIWGGGFFISSILGPPVGKYFGRKAVAYGAAILAAAHSIFLAADFVGAPVTWVAITLLFQGIGMGFVMAPLTSLVLANTPARIAGAMSGVIGSIQAAGNSVGVAIVPIPYISGSEALNSSKTSGSFVILILIAIATGILSYRTALLTESTRNTVLT